MSIQLFTQTLTTGTNNHLNFHYTNCQHSNELFNILSSCRSAQSNHLREPHSISPWRNVWRFEMKPVHTVFHFDFDFSLRWHHEIGRESFLRLWEAAPTRVTPGPTASNSNGRRNGRHLSADSSHCVSARAQMASHRLTIVPVLSQRGSYTRDVKLMKFEFPWCKCWLSISKWWTGIIVCECRWSDLSRSTKLFSIALWCEWTDVSQTKKMLSVMDNTSYATISAISHNSDAFALPGKWDRHWIFARNRCLLSYLLLSRGIPLESEVSIGLPVARECVRACVTEWNKVITVFVFLFWIREWIEMETNRTCRLLSIEPSDM